MAEFPPLASIQDVEALLGRDLTSSEWTQADALLEQASGLFRKASRQDFTPARYLQRLKVNGGEVRLPNTPVTVIHSVTDDEGSPVGYTSFGSTVSTCLRSHRFVRVDYEAGSPTTPDLVVTTVAGMVARLFNIDGRAKAGMSQYQETTGPFSEGGTFAAWAVGGQVMLAPSDIAVAESYRPTRLSNTVVHR